MRWMGVALAAGIVAAGPAAAQGTKPQITADAINTAGFEGGALPEGQSAIAARVQILLDRTGASPGVIDGFEGENVVKAIRAFEAMNDLPVDGRLDETVWERLQQAAGDAVIRHRITDEDVSRIVEPLPDDYALLAERDWLGYTDAAEKIAETWHMDREFLEFINPGADFSVGSEIWVADPGQDASPKIARVVADKSLSRLLVYGDGGNLVLSYPVSIGSEALPSPQGEHVVQAVAVEPTYTYRPDENFQQGDNDEPLILPPGPNGPVGIVWIDLSEPTYGLHGTPEPDEIGKSSSHGCVRMTNWDALELARAIKPGTTVRFKE